MKMLTTVLVLGLVSAGFVACGGDDSSSPDESVSPAVLEGREKRLTAEVGGDSLVRYEADPNGDLSYVTTEGSAQPGKVTIAFINPQSVAHDVAIESPSGKTVGKTERIGEGVTSTKVDVKPGIYVIYCSVPGHRKAGMKGHLTVR